MDHVMHHMRRDCLFYFHVEPVGQNLLDARFAIYISPGAGRCGGGCGGFQPLNRPNSTPDSNA
jgi:hypothetical protein